jgi:hypothetical protein
VCEFVTPHIYDSRNKSDILFVCSFCLTVHQVDIWNMIEAFRENGLNHVEAQQELGLVRLEAVLTTIFTQLNKRLPPSQQVSITACVALTMSWLLYTYDR